jgi:hypothetical protein
VEAHEVIESQGQAKRFFVEKIAAQARLERQPLSDDEQWMLSFSESDPEFVVDSERVEQCERSISAADYEAKVTGLLRRSYERDIESGSDARAMYRDAHAVLGQGDHYLLVMIDQALGSTASSVRGLSGLPRMLARSGLFLLLVLPASLAILLAGGLIWVVVSGQPHSAREALPFALGALLFAGIGYYLIRLWRRENRRG